MSFLSTYVNRLEVETYVESQSVITESLDVNSITLKPKNSNNSFYNLI